MLKKILSVFFGRRGSKRRIYLVPSGKAYGDVKELRRRFTRLWQDVPGHPDKLFVCDRKRNIQLILQLDENGRPDFFDIYSGQTFEEFKKLFGKQEMPYRRYKIDNGHAFMTLTVINALTAEGLW